MFNKFRVSDVAWLGIAELDNPEIRGDEGKLASPVPSLSGDVGGGVAVIGPPDVVGAPPPPAGALGVVAEVRPPLIFSVELLAEEPILLIVVFSIGSPLY